LAHLLFISGKNIIERILRGKAMKIDTGKIVVILFSIWIIWPLFPYLWKKFRD